MSGEAILFLKECGKYFVLFFLIFTYFRILYLLYKIKLDEKKIIHFVTGIILGFSIFFTIGYLMIELFGKDFELSRMIGFILALYLIYFDIKKTNFMTIRDYQNDEENKRLDYLKYKEGNMIFSTVSYIEYNDKFNF